MQVKSRSPLVVPRQLAFGTNTRVVAKLINPDHHLPWRKLRGPQRRVQILAVVIVGVALLTFSGCGGGGTSSAPPPPPLSVTVSVSPSGLGVLLGNIQQFTATVSGTSNAAVTWSVSGISSGNSTVGTISSTGLYTAPQALPNPANVTIQATSLADSSAIGSATLTILKSVAVTVSPSSSSVLLGNTQQFTATLLGTSNTAVTWSVNGISSGNSTVGTISNTGLYTAPQALPNPASVTIQAVSQADNTGSGNAALTIASDLKVGVATNPSGMSSVGPGGIVQLLATVLSAGHPDTTVDWLVNGVANGNSTVGTITVTGIDTALYTAPAAAPTPASVNITAACVADLSKSGQLVETVQPCRLNGTIGYVAPPPYTPPSGPTCDVSDVTTLGSCLTAVRNGTTTNVRFTAMVNCSGNNTCLVDLSNLHGPVTFFGAPGVTAGFLRTDTYSYPLLRIDSSSNITIANLTFDEGPADPSCTPYEVNGAYINPCMSTIIVDLSSNIMLEQLSVLHSKDHGIEIAAAQGLNH